jgi:hypothetical protein
VKRASMRQLTWTRKQNGLCPGCGGAPRPGMILCETCSKRSPEVLQGLRDQARERKQNGLCTDCGKPSDGKRQCNECRHQKDEAFRKRRADRISNGICQTCGREKVVPGTTRCARCLERSNRRSSLWDGRKESKRRIAFALKSAVFAAYGGARCACCGEDTFEFLSIDHINGGGTRHLKEISGGLYYWLREHGYPQGFQVLCFNCNFGKARNKGVCPHTGVIFEARGTAAKAAAVAAYGGCCALCGERQLVFLELHHPNQDGRDDRRRFGAGTQFYKSLQQRRWPPGYEVLCSNCHRRVTVEGRC